MNLEIKRNPNNIRISQPTLAQKWRQTLRRRRRRHDPMLVFNMSVFNFTDGWNRTFNPVKAHENG